MSDFGISALGLAIPKYALALSELVKSQQDQQMSLCAPGEDVVSLAVTAAQRALAHWDRAADQLGLIIVATETGKDMSRPLSSWVMEALKIKGQIRSYEVKHACFGGTAALRQAVEWKLSGNSKGKAALVIAADVALYAPGHSGEPTQGAGAAAMIIDTPNIASINPISYYWSDPQFDFWRPVGNKYPEVNGRLSLSCYINAVQECFAQLAPKEQLAAMLAEYSMLCFHVPFPKMVYSAVKRLGDMCGWSTEQTNACYQEKILSNMTWNQQIGNSYTASLWFAVANALTKLQAKQQFCAFSYGSGCGAELLSLQCNANQATANWHQELQLDFANRTFIDAQQYQELRKTI